MCSHQLTELKITHSHHSQPPRNTRPIFQLSRIYTNDNKTKCIAVYICIYAAERCDAASGRKIAADKPVASAPGVMVFVDS